LCYTVILMSESQKQQALTLESDGLIVDGASLATTLWLPYPRRGAEYCSEHVCLSVCLSVCSLEYLKIHMSKLPNHQIFCACCLWPWFSLLLAAL